MAFLHHVAVLVASIETSIERLGRCEHPVGPIESFPSEGTRECYIGEDGAAARLLLMQSTAPDGPYGRALRRRGPGLHHVALDVRDLVSFIEGLSGSGWYLLPQSLRSIESSATAWLGRPGVGTLLEIQEREQSTGAAVVTRIEVPVDRRLELLTSLRPDGQQISGLDASPDAGAWLTLGGRRWNATALAT